MRFWPLVQGNQSWKLSNPVTQGSNFSSTSHNFPKTTVFVTLMQCRTAPVMGLPGNGVPQTSSSLQLNCQLLQCSSPSQGVPAQCSSKGTTSELRPLCRQPGTDRPLPKPWAHLSHSACPGMLLALLHPGWENNSLGYPGPYSIPCSLESGSPAPYCPQVPRGQFYFLLGSTLFTRVLCKNGQSSAPPLWAQHSSPLAKEQ